MSNRARPISFVLAMAGVLALTAGQASAKRIVMPTLTKAYQEQTQYFKAHEPSTLTPPPVPCPENGYLPSTPVTGPCGITELPATGLPLMGNMAYYGGHVDVHPRVYVVYWGWGEKGAWPKSDKCRRERIREGAMKVRLPCDPQGAGKYTANWAYQMGGTQWADVSDQYYEGGTTHRYIDTKAKHWLKGMWVDDRNSIRGLPKTSASNPAGKKNTYTDLAAEAGRAVKYFERHHKLNKSERADSNIVVMQPPNYSDPNALSTGYCAFHDWIAKGFEKGIYDPKYTDGVQGVAYTNAPYLLAINSGGVNVCGKDAVNPAPKGNLDGFSIAFGHEIQETITDPGAEDVSGSGAGVKYLGGWYDTIDADENGDKCAWVGENPLTDQQPVLPIPGALGDVKGNGGQTFAVQSLWSNDAAGGAGYCAGAGTDLPSTPGTL
jgi:serine protease